LTVLITPASNNRVQTPPHQLASGGRWSPLPLSHVTTSSPFLTIGLL
jgi:hypothetical protein